MNHLVISPVAQQESNFWNNHVSTLDERNIAVDVILAVSKKETSQASRHHCGIGWFGCDSKKSMPEMILDDIL